MLYQLDSKIIFWILAVFFTFLSYFIYYKSIFKWESKPHIFSWLIWGIISLVIFIIQLNDNAWIWAMNTWFVALLCLWIWFLSFKKWEKEITKQDTISFIFWMLSIFLWLFTEDPYFSILLLIGIDVFWFIPTFLKSYKKPFEENASAYLLASMWYFCSILALSHLTFLTVWFIVVTFSCNLILSIMIFARQYFSEEAIA